MYIDYEALVPVLIIIGIILLIFGLGAVVFFILRRERIKQQRENDILLCIEVPKGNEKTPLAAEQMFASLHGLYRSMLQRLVHGDVSLSFEMAASKKAIRFYCRVPQNVEEFVTKQIFAQYPNVRIQRAEDYVNFYAIENVERETAIAYIRSNKASMYPIKTFTSFEVDPLAAITSALSGLSEEEDIWFQMVITPVNHSWQTSAQHYVQQVREGKSTLMGDVFGKLFREIFEILFVYVPDALIGRSRADRRSSQRELPDSVKEALTKIEEKSKKIGFAAIMRIAAITPDQQLSRQRLNEFISTLQQYTVPNLNGFHLGKRIFNVGGFKEAFKLRAGKRKGIILNVEELASIYHFPNQSVETPNIVWARARKGEPPPNLPVTGEGSELRDLTIYAKTDFRREERKFGIKQPDRLRHLYVIGKTGMGKSTMLANMAIDDVRSGRGVAVIDPHGDLYTTVLDYIPKKRINDVELFNPSDKDYPVALNMLESVDDAYKSLVASGMIAVFYKLYADSWGPRLEHILRNTILALLDSPDSTLLGISRVLVDKDYRRMVVNHIKNPTVRMFWDKEFPQIETSRAAAEALGAVQNKVGQFLSTPVVRNIVGQPRSTINLRQIMDERKILLINLSKGLMGEDVSSLLGSMLITKVQLAAMSRSDIPEEQRIPYHLYVDEFQNFATNSFATILSEARKYKLGLTMANQYIAQMPDEVREAVFGNVGTLISFAIGASDAQYVAREFSAVFTEEDLVHLDKYNIYLRMTIDGKNSEPFSATTLPLPVNVSGNTDKILKVSRERYTKPVDTVEEKIMTWAGMKQLEEGKPETIQKE
ncbi:MAG TPA: type IV secretion system DNA-binding domain-containing protein [bacterium]|nr:type IV secretion system DNA-binding domain-containing protein [bacterium]